MTKHGQVMRPFPPVATEPPARHKRLCVCDGCGTEYWMNAPATRAWCFVCWTWTSYSKVDQEREMEALDEFEYGDDD